MTIVPHMVGVQRLPAILLLGTTLTTAIFFGWFFAYVVREQLTRYERGRAILSWQLTQLVAPEDD